MKFSTNRMKAFFLLFVGLLFLNTGFAQTGKYSYTNSWGKKGLSVSEQKSSGVSLNYSIEGFSISEQEINGKQRHTISLPNHLLPNNEGAPNLPGSGNYIALPNGAKAQYEIVEIKFEIIENVDVAPAPRIPLDNDNSPLVYKEKDDIYSVNAFFPESPVTISDNFNLRGVNSVIVGVTPFQYNPITKQLKVIHDIKIELTHTGGNGEYGEKRLRSRWWDPIINDALLNNDVLPKIDYNARLQDQNAVDNNNEFEYVIITPNDPAYLSWADSIKIFRNMQGIKTGIVTLEEIGANSVNAIEDYVNDIYYNWEMPPAAILLLGDYGSSMDNNITSPIYDNYCVSDNIFADVDNDQLPDIVFARITANDEEQLSVMVRKFLTYETNPPTSANFYNHPITALGWQTERWFQICSETVGGFWKNELGKEPVRINAVYGGNPNTDPWSTATNTATVMDYFGPDGLGYIPATPAELGGFSGGSAQDVTDAINDGSFMLQHRDHGMETGWGEPDYTNNNINDLTNTDLSYIFSINCLTGKYNHSSEVFAEKFHRHTYNDELSGALGILAASEVSYSFVNDTYVWGLFDYMWPEFMPDYGGEFPTQRDILPAFANAYGKYFLEQSSWPYNTNNKEVTYHLFHHHGDAFLNVYTEVPVNLTVDHADVMVSGAPFFEISSDEGSFIALSVEGVLIATGEATGDFIDIPVEFQIPGTIIDVVITKQNHFRYHAEVLVIPPDGPYVIKDSFIIHDATGNNDGVADFGESISLSVDMKNVGNIMAEDVVVTISTENEFITIQNASADFGNVAAEQTVSVNNAFSLAIASDIPDQEMVVLQVSATNGTDIWVSYIKFPVNAPELEILGMELIELDGNGNGYFDPGETGEITIEFTNIGHSRAVDINSLLTSTSSYADITLGEVSFDGINPQEVLSTTFVMEVDMSTPLGTGILIMNNIDAGAYLAYKEFTTKVGLIFEDWETGDLTNFGWNNASSSPWVIVEDEVYEGAYALKSGAINDSQNTILEINYTTMGNDSISFFKKVSSENSYDFLRFYIDDQEKQNWCGEIDWSRSVFFVPEGEHTFKWVYTKDGTQASGQDCGWVDFIVFPPELATTAWAGSDIETCIGNTIELEAMATYYESVLWESTGSGLITGYNTLTPSYNPSAQDYEDGSVIFTITVTGTSGNILTDEIVVTFTPEMTFELAEEFTMCADDQITFSPIIENFNMLEWSTSGDGSFEDNHTLIGLYTPGEEDILNGSVNISLFVDALGNCENVNQDINLTINPKATATLEGEFDICVNEEIEISTVLSGVAPWNIIIKDIISGEEFEFTAETEDWSTIMTMTENCTLQMTSLKDANGCVSEGIGEILINVNLLPESPVIITEIETVDINNSNETTLEGTEAMYALSHNWTISPAEAGELTMDGLTANIVWNTDFEGDVTITLDAQNDCGNTVAEKVIFVWNTVGFGENEGVESFDVYPNPSDGIFKVNLSLINEENINITIVNILGKTVWTKSYGEVQIINDHIDVNNLAKGTYMLRVQSNNINTIKKLIIK